MMIYVVLVIWYAVLWIGYWCRLSQKYQNPEDVSVYHFLHKTILTVILLTLLEAVVGAFNFYIQMWSSRVPFVPIAGKKERTP